MTLHFEQIFFTDARTFIVVCCPSPRTNSLRTRLFSVGQFQALHCHPLAMVHGLL
jgi:hypothetical protein